MLRGLVGTFVFVDFFLLADESSQPQRVVVIEDDALIGGVLLPVVFEHGGALLVLSQFEQIFRQKEDCLEGRLGFIDIDMVLSMGVGVAHDEIFDKEGLVDIVLSGYAEEKLADPFGGVGEGVGGEVGECLLQLSLDSGEGRYFD